MTHRPIRTEADGTRVYADYHRYRPKKLSERAYGINKPDDPAAVRFYGRWFLPLPVLPDEQRVLPETIPDNETLLHKARCLCRVCRRPQSAELWRRRRARS
jgi:hypothetical protein